MSNKLNGKSLETLRGRAKTKEELAQEKLVHQFGLILGNVKGRLDNPVAPVTDQLQRHRMTLELLSGAAFALIAVEHPLGPSLIAMANRAGQMGEKAMDLDLNDIFKAG